MQILDEFDQDRPSKRSVSRDACSDGRTKDQRAELFLRGRATPSRLVPVNNDEDQALTNAAQSATFEADVAMRV